MASTVRSDWRSHTESVLAETGSRIGGARGAVIDVLARQSCCVSAREIWDELRDDGVGIASVYRAVDLLHRAGLLQRVEVGGGGVRYEPVMPSGEHHHHAVCEVCGRITPFEDDALEAAIERLAGDMSHSVGTHEVVLRGRCRGCQRSRRAASKR